MCKDVYICFILLYIEKWKQLSWTVNLVRWDCGSILLRKKMGVLQNQSLAKLPSDPTWQGTFMWVFTKILTKARKPLLTILSHSLLLLKSSRRLLCGIKKLPEGSFFYCIVNGILMMVCQMMLMMSTLVPVLRPVMFTLVLSAMSCILV